MLNVFYGWRLQTLIQLRGWTTSSVVIQRRWKINFLICFCFWFVLLFCRLLWKDLGELVSMMEHNFDYSLKILQKLCESWFCEGIGKKISGEQRDQDWKGYIWCWLKKTQGEFFWWRKEVKLLDIQDN